MEISCPHCNARHKIDGNPLPASITCSVCRQEIPLASEAIAAPSEAPPLPAFTALESQPNVSQWIDQAEKASHYRLLHKTLKPAGFGSILFGVIAIVMGGAGMQDNPINAVLALIGLLLFAEGLWIVIAPSPKGMIIDGIALIILGVWNILVTIANASSGGSGGFHFFAVLGVFQIIWGFKSFGRYSRFSQNPVQKPSPEMQKQIDDLANAIRKAKFKNAPDIIEFQAKSFSITKPWKGKLEHDRAIFADIAGEEIIFAEKNRVRFFEEGSQLLGKSLKVDIQLRDRKMKGTISPESLERFTEWKGED